MKQKISVMPTYIIERKAPRRISILPVEEEKQVTEEIVTAAEKFETARKISLAGDASGAILFDGSEDAILKVVVKNSARAVRDAKGNVINETYAKKNELDNYAKKDDVTNRLNYLEKVVYETKNAANASLREQDLSFATAEDISDLF